ncbi:hypothetical protein AHF37_09967 [Paragonimus kellicotti]|nr:hypothetical protein AHF37_09967 [Paragonimus kellicotti]
MREQSFCPNPTNDHSFGTEPTSQVYACLVHGDVIDLMLNDEQLMTHHISPPFTCCPEPYRTGHILMDGESERAMRSFSNVSSAQPRQCFHLQ